LIKRRYLICRIFIRLRLKFEKIKGTITNGQPRYTSNIGHTKHMPRGKNPINSTQLRKLKQWATRTSPKHWGELNISRRVSSSTNWKAKHLFVVSIMNMQNSNITDMFIIILLHFRGWIIYWEVVYVTMATLKVPIV